MEESRVSGLYQGNRDMENLNVKSCNAHLAEELEGQMALIKGALEAVQEGELKKAKLFLKSANRGNDRTVEFLQSMIEAA